MKRPLLNILIFYLLIGCSKDNSNTDIPIILHSASSDSIPSGSQDNDIGLMPLEGQSSVVYLAELENLPAPTTDEDGLFPPVLLWMTDPEAEDNLLIPNPGAVSAGPKGIVVSDYSDAQIWYLSLDGKIQSRIGRKGGGGPGEYGGPWPYGIEVRDNGNIMVWDMTFNRLNQFLPNGLYDRSLSIGAKMGGVTFLTGYDGYYLFAKIEEQDDQTLWGRVFSITFSNGKVTKGCRIAMEHIGERHERGWQPSRNWLGQKLFVSTHHQRAVMWSPEDCTLRFIDLSTGSLTGDEVNLRAIETGISGKSGCSIRKHKEGRQESLYSWCEADASGYFWLQQPGGRTGDWYKADVFSPEGVFVGEAYLPTRLIRLSFIPQIYHKNDTHSLVEVVGLFDIDGYSSVGMWLVSRPNGD